MFFVLYIRRPKMLYGDGLRGDSPQTPGTLQVSNGLNVAMFKSHTMLSPLDVLAVALVGWLSYRWYLFTEIRRKVWLYTIL